MIKLAQGAEAVIFREGDKVIKERLSKGYRISEIDESLRKFRTRREAKILQRLEEIQFPAPHLQEFSDKRMSITMDFLPGEKLRDVLEKGDEYQGLAKELGMKIGKLHAQNIVHGDLTTSNMLVAPQTRELSFIDFGLSVFSDKVEDKAVDLFLLDRALESKHYQLYPEIFEKVLEGYYEANPEARAVMDRYNAVMKRGRNKKK
jgi:TP53 regulating kinase-like protein